MLVTSSRLRRLKRVERMSFSKGLPPFLGVYPFRHAPASRGHPTASYCITRPLRTPRARCARIATSARYSHPYVNPLADRARERRVPSGEWLRASSLAHGEEQLPVFAGTRDGRPAQRDQDIQDIQRQESGGDVPGALRCGEHLLRSHTARSADALVHVIDGGLVDQVEVAGTTTRPRQRERQHEKITLALEYMVGLTHRPDP